MTGARIAPIVCDRGGCTLLARYSVGLLSCCGRHVVWALDWSGVNDRPSTGAGRRAIAVRAHAGWEQA